MAKVGALAWEEYLGTAPRGYMELRDGTSDVKWPSMAPFGEFRSWSATEVVCFYVKARAEGSFKFETCQVRVSSRARAMNRWGANDCAWFGGKLRLGGCANYFGWFVGKL
ncbi:MAG: hypothetical protein ACTS41_01735 [Candidatus Hodgkinia cicadicola]